MLPSVSSSKSDQIVWSNLLPRDGYKEDSQDDSSKLILLDGTKSAPTVTVTVEELQPKWIDICIEQKRPNDVDLFCLRSVLPLLLREDSIVLFTNKTAETADSGEIYVTELELRRLWAEKSQQAMGKGMDKFDLEEALLLLTDEEDDMLMGSDEDDDVDGDAARGGAAAGRAREEEEGGVEVLDEQVDEYFISTQELQRLWDQRAAVKWGLPEREFDEKLALLLIDDDEDDDRIYRSFIDLQTNTALSAGSASVALSTDTVTGKYEELGLSSDSLAEYGAEEDAPLRESISRMHADLEDRTYQRPAWRKDRHFLSPDIDTQRFMGDIMMSNTYMTQRIPANWNDPEVEEMSETYLDTNSMAMPGEEETDYNLNYPIWEVLDLPFRPQDEEEEEDLAMMRPLEDQASVVDWSTFDFAAAEGVVADATKPAGEQLDVESFFSNLKPEGDGEETDVFKDAFRDGMDNDDPRKEDEPFVVPPEWLDNPEFADHVGFEVWSQYPVSEFYGADDSVWDEDVFLKQSLAHVQRVTDEYLVDHEHETQEVDDYRTWERVLYHQITGDGEVERDRAGVPILNEAGEPNVREDIPIYLTPDKNRGVDYSDEVIEMKSKMTLHVALPPPAKLFENDSFTHNTDFETMNKIGTIRVQYDWQPELTLLPYHIDQAIVHKIEPVMQYVNYAAKLRSTKDNILVFEYFGQMRHLLGIRESMYHIARQCWPEIQVRSSPPFV